MKTLPMNGKTVVITGATAGIGEATAIELARLGADLVLIARNPEKAHATIRTITREAPASRVRFVEGDLSSMASVRRAATEVLETTEKIDVLINNAGIAALQSRTTDEGFDEMLATNYLGPFLLTHLLLDRLRASAPARIVVVGSEAHRLAGHLDPEHFDDLGTYSGLWSQLAYGRTKLLDLLMAAELGRRLSGSGVTANSLCPGFVATDLGREAGLAGQVMKWASATRVVRTPERGARMTVHLASSPSVDGVTGRFFTSTAPARLFPTVSARRDPALAARVYERTCDLVGVSPVATSEVEGAPQTRR